jgi:integrase
MSAYVLKSESYYRNFKQSIKSIETFITYDQKLRAFMKYKGISLDNYQDLIEDKDTRTIESDIIDFLISLKEKHYSLSSQEVYLSALIHFYTINDVNVRRKKISKFLSNDDTSTDADICRDIGDSSGGNNDKPYSHQQIARLLEFSDLREKAIILLMASSGMRIGALPLLKIGDLTLIPDHGIYQIRVYANSKSNRHYTFCTPECRKSLDNYLDYRRQCGENITPKSPLFRREFDKRDIFQVANDVKPLTRNSIKTALRQVLYASGVRTPLSIRENFLNCRRDIAMSHGFRKFFDTNATHAGTNPIYRLYVGSFVKGS